MLVGPGRQPVVLLQAVFALEALDSAGGVDQALLTGVKRMTLRAYFDVQGRDGRARFEGIATGTGDHAASILRMNSRFHFFKCVSDAR